MDMQRLRIGSEVENAPAEQSANNSIEQELRDFCNEVLEKIKAEGVLATPLNFQVIFERQLTNKGDEFKEVVSNLLDAGKQTSYDDYVDLERHLRSSFRSIKQIFEVIAVLYRNQSLFYEVLDKRIAELKQVDNPIMSRNIVQGLVTEVNRLKDITRRQSEQLKTLYQQSADVINSVDNNTVFDPQYGIYNKQFITTSLEKELAMPGLCNSTLLVVNLADSIAKEVNDANILTMLQCNVAEMLLKTSRRSDIVAHYENGVFAILLRHSDLEVSQAVCKRLFTLIKSSSTFIDSKKITLEINIAITPLKPNDDIDKLFDKALKTLKELGAQSSVFKVVGG